MQWSLFAVVLIVNALFGASCASAENGKGQISSVFEAFGYSPACVASALTSCEFSSTKELSVDVVDSIEVTKSLLQEMKSEIKAIRQETKSAEENFSSVMKSLLQEMKYEIKALRQEIKPEGESSSSVVKALLQEMNSEIKAIRQEMKSEINAIRQEMKSAEENSSSVVNSLLQEMKPAEENSSSVVNSLLQEMKPAEENSSSVVKTTAAPEGKELPKNCAELKEQCETSSGVQTVYPYGSLNPKPTTVYCDQVTDGGGWTVIQSRSPLPIRENFQRNWDEYVEGFGNRTGEFWLGLDNIHALTNSAKMLLRIDLEDAEGERRWAHYSTFHVGDAASEYVLRIGGYSGDAGDAMTSNNNMKFSTFDNDNDLYPSGNCAESYKGGWWFNWCSYAHLNGLPIVGEAPYGQGILWSPFRGWHHSMKKVTMKLRPVSFDF